jgi:hypothetical protein
MPTKKKKGNQQKAKSPTMKTVSQPKPEEPPGVAKDSTSNLCDDCAFDFGACEGKPKFASEFQEGLTGAEADRVVQCVTFKNVGDMPTADELAKKGKPVVEEGPYLRGANDGEINDEGLAEELATGTEATGHDYPRAPGIDRPDPKRFEKEEDFGNCGSCEEPLKRTALNRYIDAVRCVNPHCRAFRVVVKNIPTGAK